jgi:hypothetical protein
MAEARHTSRPAAREIPALQVRCPPPTTLDTRTSGTREESREHQEPVARPEPEQAEPTQPAREEPQPLAREVLARLAPARQAEAAQVAG